MASSGNYSTHIGLLLLRVGASVLLLHGHGWPKLMNFAERSATFADPIGLGSHASLTLVVVAEVVCATLVLLGLATRISVVPILGFFAVAFFIQHAADPWPKREFVLIYVVPFLTLLFTGPGRFSLDAMIARVRSRRRS